MTVTSGARWFSRSALLLAGLSGGVLLATAFGLAPSGPATVIAYTMHAGVLGLGLTLVVRLAWLQMRPSRGRHGFPPASTPRAIKIATFAGLLAFLASAAYVVVVYGEGGVEIRAGQYAWVRDGRVVRQMSQEDYAGFQVAMLRVFASAWLFASLMMAWAGRVVENTMAVERHG